MIITPSTRTITEYQLVVTADEAAGALTDPYTFADRLVEQFRAAGVTPATNGNGQTHKPGKASQFTINPRGRKAGRASRPNAKGVNCPQCGKTLKTQGFLDRHLRQKHAEITPAPSASAA